MENIERLLGELALNNFDSESMHWVDVVYVVNPLDFYVCPVKYNRLIATYRRMTPTKKVTEIKLQDMVFYNLYQQARGRYYIRGRISRICTDNDTVACDIFAIDYGFTDKLVPLEHLWECSPELLNTPALAYHSQLANCFPVGSSVWTEYATKIFRSHMGTGRVKMTVLGRTSTKLVIKLMNANLHDVATLLAVGGVTDVGSYYDCIPWKPLIVRKRFNFEYKKVNLNEKIRVKVLGGKSLKKFYVKEVKDYKQFWTDADNITFYARREYTLIPNHLIEGVIICVKDKEKNQYHRAIIKKVTKLYSTAILQLVDWGRDEEFPVDRMKYMSKQSLRTHLTTLYCSAPAKQAWDNGFEKFLTPGFEFYITIKRLGYELECPHTVNISPVEDEKCEGATALPEKPIEETKIEPLEDFFPGKNTCSRDSVKKLHLGCGDFEYLNTPDISPAPSDEEDDCNEPITWHKLVTKRRRAPYRGIGYKFVLPKAMDKTYKIKQPEQNCEGATALVVESSENKEEYEFEFSNIGDPSTATDITEKKCDAAAVPTTVTPTVTENLEPAENTLKATIPDAADHSLKNEDNDKKNEDIDKNYEGYTEIIDEIEYIETIEVQLKYITIENDQSVSTNEKKENSQEHKDG